MLLHVTHHWGGGTEQHVQELCDHLGAKAEHIVLHSRADGWIILSVPGHDDLALHPERDFDVLAHRLVALGVTRIHLHQLFTVPVDVRRLARELRVPLDFTVHDYHTICPRVHMKTRDMAYCGDPDEAGCHACLVDHAPVDERDIASYRARYSWVYREAARVICPSRDVAARVARYHPQAPLQVVPHPRLLQAHPTPCPPPLEASAPLRVAILGWVTAFKGAARVLEAARIIEREGHPIVLRVIGTIDGEVPPTLEVSGRYAPHELAPMLAAHPPHLIWYAAQVPETYSYILTEGFEAGLPVMVPRVGAFPERVSGRAWSWIVDWDISPRDAVERLLAIREDVLGGNPPPLPRHEVETSAPTPQDFYRNHYLS